MTYFEFDCAYCGEEVRLTPEQIILSRISERATVGTYRYDHGCGMHQRKASERVVRSFIDAGVLDEVSMVTKFERQINRVVTPADMGFVS